MDKLPNNESRGIISWMARHGVTSNLLMLALLGGGFLACFKIKQEVFPEFELDAVTVSVPYPGASPEEVEKGIVLAIEEVVQGIDGVDEVSSRSSEGSGVVTVDLVKGGDLQKLADDIRSEVDRITSFPVDAEEPRVAIRTRRRQVLEIIVHGKHPELTLREVAEQVREKLLTDANITQVDLSGKPFEISIEIPGDTLRKYGLTLKEVASHIRSAAIELPGGSIKTQGGEILVRMKERRDYGREFAALRVITLSNGTTINLGDIATIRDEFSEVDRVSSYDGNPGIRLQIYRIGEQTPISVADAVRKNMEELNQTLPGGIKITLLNDRSKMYKDRLGLLIRNGGIGLLLVICLLGLFLDIRLAFWVMMGVPISFLGGLLFMPMLGVSINMISMFGFIIALGIVVDDAIVVGENVYHYHQEGEPFLVAAIKGTREVAVPVTFSILTNVVAFMPLAFIDGRMGKFLKFIPYVVILVFMISLAEALFILPAHLGHKNGLFSLLSRGFKRATGGIVHSVFGFFHGLQQRFSRWFTRLVRVVYGPFLEKVLRYRYLSIGVGITIFILTISLWKAGHVRFIFMEPPDSDYGLATVTLPYGAHLSKAEAIRDQLIAAAKRVGAQVEADSGQALIEGIYSEVGEGGSHNIQVKAYLVDPEFRPVNTSEFARRWHKETGPMIGVETSEFIGDAGGPGSGKSISLELSHTDLSILKQAGEELAEGLGHYNFVRDVDDGFQEGKIQYDMNVKPEGEALGLTAAYVAREIRSAFYGAEAFRQQRGRNEVKVMVRRPIDERSYESQLETFILQTPSGIEVPLREVVTMTKDRSYTTIERQNGRRVINVTANVRPRNQTDVVMTGLEEKELKALLGKYPGLRYGLSGRQKSRGKSMGSLKVGMLVALLLIYALLAIPLNSYVQPAIIMVSIPFGIIGAVLGHWVMGYSLSFISMFGIVALSGVVVNDALVLIDYANRQHNNHGKSHMDAVLAAGQQRFRPIMLTTLTTFGGLSPMILETSRQARFLIPMAISLGFGILFATFITLILVPCLYMVTEDVLKLYRR